MTTQTREAAFAGLTGVGSGGRTSSLGQPDRKGHGAGCSARQPRGGMDPLQAPPLGTDHLHQGWASFWGAIPATWKKRG